MFNWLKKKPWYSVYLSSQELTREEREFLDNYTEEEFCGLLSEYLINKSKVTVKQAVQWIMMNEVK